MKLGQIYADPETVETVVEAIAAEDRRSEYARFFEKYPSLLSLRLFGRTWELSSFALFVVIGAILALLLLRHESRRSGLKKGTVSTLAVLLPPLGLVFAHAFYVLASPGLYAENPSGILSLWEGGYAMWGAFIGFIPAVLLAARISREKASALFDACAAPAALFVAVCRFASYPFSGEGKGRPLVENTVFARFPFAVTEDGAWFCAVFLLEALFALVILHFTLASPRKGGDKARLFLILYSASQILCESLYGDSGKMVWHQFVRVPMLACAVALVILFIVGILRHAPDSSRLPGGRIAGLSAALLHSILLIIGMEFAISKLPIWPVWADYLIIADCCFLLGYAVYRAALPPLRSGAALRGQRIAEAVYVLLHGIAFILGAVFVAGTYARNEQTIFTDWACWIVIADACLFGGCAIYCLVRRGKGAGRA